MRFRQKGLLVAVGICVVAWLASLGTDTLAPAYPEIHAQVEGVFSRDGHHHGEPLTHADSVRRWGSLAGSDANQGALAFGAAGRERTALP